MFADLGLRDPGRLLAKAELTRQIFTIIRERRLTQAEAAKLLGLKQPDVSLLMRGRHIGFSTDRLLKLLNALGRDVEIVVKKRRKGGTAYGTVTVVAA